ncbi:MAG: hypothetical protein K5872_08825 [Rhizobiaceae bacterium]|nr:hypothetical protein [Rhizobiaceae bacterium]MCV0406318.1 hypothetical protein [Rhizobiaceae bacterium]
MALQNWYAFGSASVSNGSTTVTGHNTGWGDGTGAVRAGDRFGTHVAGGGVRIVSVADEELTLAYPWWGATQVDAAYEIEIVPDRSRVQETSRRLLEILSGRGFFRYDAAGETADLSDYDNRARGFAFLDTSTDPMRLYVKQSDAVGDWGGPVAYATGPTGPAPNLSAGTTTTGAPGTNASASITGVNPNYTANFTIPRGDQGFKGWAPVFSVVPDGVTRSVLQLDDWTGGEGTKPGNIGDYLGPTGFVGAIGDAVSVQGEIGPMGPASLSYQGVWQVGETYNINDIVQDDDLADAPALWIALRETTGDKPRDSAEDWALFPATFSTAADYGLTTDAVTETRDYGVAE